MCRWWQSFSPPALGECSHCCLARLSIAVRRRSVLVLPVSQCPHPRCPRRRCCGLKDTPDDESAIIDNNLERQRDPVGLVGARGRSSAPILFGFTLHRRVLWVLVLTS